jgi:hypothetical protein
LTAEVEGEAAALCLVLAGCGEGVLDTHVEAKADLLLLGFSSSSFSGSLKLQGNSKSLKFENNMLIFPQISLYFAVKLS